MQASKHRDHHFPMLVCEPKFHSWGRCTIALTKMHSDLRSNPSSDLCINLDYLFTWILYFTSWGVTIHVLVQCIHCLSITKAAKLWEVNTGKIWRTYVVAIDALLDPTRLKIEPVTMATSISGSYPHGNRIIYYIFIHHLILLSKRKSYFVFICKKKIYKKKSSIICKTYKKNSSIYLL